MSDWINSTVPDLQHAGALAPQQISMTTHEIWDAAEQLVSDAAETRRAALVTLLQSNAHLQSPLVLYILSTRVRENDLGLRRKIIVALSAAFKPPRGNGGGPPIRDALGRYLRAFGRDDVLSILQAVAHEGPSTEVVLAAAAQLLDHVPGAADHLARLASDRSLSARVRASAIAAIGEIGFLDAQPMLEGLLTRLEARRAGQLGMGFGPQDDPDEPLLLPAVQRALELLIEND